MHVAKADIALLIESMYIIQLARLRVHVAKADTALLLESMYIVRLTINSTVEKCNMGLIALVTGTGITNSTRLRLVQFHALPVPVTRAINPHIALSTVLLTIQSDMNIEEGAIEEGDNAMECNYVPYMSAPYRVWSLLSGVEMSVLPHPCYVYSVCFGPTHTPPHPVTSHTSSSTLHSSHVTLFTGAYDKLVRVWTLAPDSVQVLPWQGRKNCSSTLLPFSLSPSPSLPPSSLARLRPPLHRARPHG